MNPIEFTIQISIDEEIDDALYGHFYSHTRDGLRFDGAPFVQMEKGGEWIPVRDWRAGKYDIDAKTLRNLAKHFIEIGKHIKE